MFTRPSIAFTLIYLNSLMIKQCHMKIPAIGVVLASKLLIDTYDICFIGAMTQQKSPIRWHRGFFYQVLFLYF